MKFRCYLSSLLRIHRPDCEHCKAREKCGIEMRERLAELNSRTQTYSFHTGNQGQVVGVFDSRPDEVVVSQHVSLVEPMEKAG